MRNARKLLVASFALSCVCLAGCARTQPTHYYIITPVATGAAAKATLNDLAVGVGPVTLPPYMDRAQMADIAGENEVRFAEFHRWAEPLDVMLVRVLKEDLSGQLGTQSVAAYPWPSGVRPDVAVEVEVLRLGRLPNGHIVLDARWRLRTSKGAGELQRAAIETPSEADNYAAYASACSKAVAKLSSEIAQAATAGTR